MNFKPWIAGCLSFVICSNTHALTGNDLMSQLSSKDAMNEIAFVAFMHGFVEANSLYERHPGRKLFNPYFCPPPTATTSQFRAVVQKYLESHPEELHKDAGVLLAKAFRTSWPCK